MKSMSWGDNYLQLIKLSTVLAMVSVIEPARWVQEEGQRVVRSADDCCNGSAVQATRGLSALIEDCQEESECIRSQHTRATVCTSDFLYIYCILTQLSSTDDEKHLSWCMIYFLIPGPLIHVWCLTHFRLLSRCIEYLGVLFVLRVVIYGSKSDRHVRKTVPQALFLLLCAKLHTKLR